MSNNIIVDAGWGMTKAAWGSEHSKTVSVSSHVQVFPSKEKLEGTLEVNKKGYPVFLEGQYYLGGTEPVTTINPNRWREEYTEIVVSMAIAVALGKQQPQHITLLIPTNEYKQGYVAPIKTSISQILEKNRETTVWLNWENNIKFKPFVHVENISIQLQAWGLACFAKYKNKVPPYSSIVTFDIGTGTVDTMLFFDAGMTLEVITDNIGNEVELLLQSFTISNLIKTYAQTIGKSEKIARVKLINKKQIKEEFKKEVKEKVQKLISMLEEHPDLDKEDTVLVFGGGGLTVLYNIYPELFDDFKEAHWNYALAPSVTAQVQGAYYCMQGQK